MNKAVTTFATLIASALVLAGCAATPHGPPEVTSAAPAPVASETVEPVATPSVGAVGDTFTYESGLTLTLTKITPTTISQYAAGGNSHQRGVIVAVKLTNHTDIPFDTSLVQVDLRYGADGEQADQVYDGDGPTSADGFSGTIGRGRSGTARYEFAIPKQAAKTEVDVTVTPDWDSTVAEFHGRV